MAEKLEACLHEAWNEFGLSRRCVDCGQSLPGATATPDRSGDALAEENRRLREALVRIADSGATKWPDGAVEQNSAIVRIARAALKGDGL